MTRRYPLSRSARGTFFAQLLDPSATCYNTAELVELAPDTDLELLRSALEAVYRENEGLRVSTGVEKGEPYQLVLDTESFVALNPLFPLGQIEPGEAADTDGINGVAGNEPAGTLPEAVTSWARELTALPLNLAEGRTVRSAAVYYGGRLWLYHGFHHLVADGFTAFSALSKLFSCYRQLAAGQEPAPKTGGNLAELHAAETAIAHLYDEHLDAWEAEELPESLLQLLSERESKERGSRVLAQPDTGIAGHRAAPVPGAHRASAPISPALEQNLGAAASAHRVPWSTVITAAVGAYLGRLAGQSLAQFGVPQMNRLLPGELRPYSLTASQTACSAVNVLPVTCATVGSIAESLAAVQDQLNRNQRLALARQEDLERRAEQAGGRLFSAQINVVPFDAVLSTGAGRARVHNISAGPVTDITVCLRGAPGRGALSLEIDANPALYTAEETAAHADRLLEWLDSWATEALAGGHLDRLSTASAEERRALAELHPTRHPVRYRTLLERFCRQVERTPDAPALYLPAPGVPGGAASFPTSLTYRQLDLRARALAGALLARGVTKQAPVALRVERGQDQFELLYALLYAGAIYVPISPDLPRERVEGMLADAGAHLLINGQNLTPLGTVEGTAEEVSWEELVAEATAEATPLAGYPGERTWLDDTAYILFTSGSTGRPKGVAVSHRALDNRLRWQQSIIPVGEGDRVLHKTPISFDVHIWELYWPLQEGAAVVVAAPGGHRDPDYLVSALTRANITCLHFVPTMLGAFLTSPAARTLEATELSLKYLVCSGEALQTEQVSAAARTLGIYPLNLYGPTEAAIDVTYWQTGQKETQGAIPIGTPVWNTETHILDRAQKPLPPGYTGELYLAGVQLACGYTGRRADQSAFSTWSGRRIYRTGDLAAYLPDGSIAYRGRTDHQVKVRGQRLELGEIDTLLSSLEGVYSAVTLALPTGIGDHTLAAYLETALPEDDIIRAAKDACTAALPDYMVPTLWARYRTFPTGSSGKTDRAALAAHVFARSDSSRGTVPKNLLTQQLCGLFARALGRETYGAEENFFTAGGSSLSALHLVSLIDRELGLSCQLGAVFTAPTPAKLADALTGDGAGEYRPLLTLRPAAEPDSAAYLFVPPAGGLGWCYAGYLGHLPAGAGVYALQAEQFSTPDASWPETLQELAADYLRHCRPLLGRPLILVGWSLGGMCAPLLAEAIRDAGGQVERLILLDAYPPEQWADVPAPDEQETHRALLRMAGLEAGDAQLTLENTLERLRESGSALGTLPAARLATLLEAMHRSAAMIRASFLPEFSLLLTAISVPHPERPELDAAAWAGHNRAETKLVSVAGEHPDLVRPAAVAGFIEHIVSK